MTLFINIVITLIVMFWPMVWVSSVMMAGGPGASNDASLIFTAIALVSYPLLIFIFLAVFNIPFWGINSVYFVAISAIVICLTQIPNFMLLSNLNKGIANSGYSVAGDIAYYNGKPIESADAASFQVLDDELLPSRVNYAWDSVALYFKGKVIEGAKPSELKRIFSGSDGYYVSSNDQVFHSGLVLKDCEPSGFRMPGYSGGGWSVCDVKDASFVYFYNQKVEGADGRSFVPLGGHIGKDASHFYSQDNILETDADPLTFDLLQAYSRYGRDAKSVYFVGTQLSKIEGADHHTFEEVHSNTPVHSDARDADYLYYVGERIGRRNAESQ